MKDYEFHLKRLQKELDSCDAIVIGAGAGLSTSAGFIYSGERFFKWFFDYEEKYGFTNMYAGDFIPSLPWRNFGRTGQDIFM